MLCTKFGLNCPCGSGEEDANVKSLQTDRQTDDGRQVIRKAHWSFQLSWYPRTGLVTRNAQVKYKALAFTVQILSARLKLQKELQLWNDRSNDREDQNSMPPNL